MLIAANWKMYKGPAEAADFCLGLRDEDLSGVDVVVCPPFISLAVAVQVLAGTEIAVVAQNVHWEDEGAFTGEISPTMLRELGVYGALVGPSERRQHFGETDDMVGKRAQAAIDRGLFVIACVGETETERERGETEDVLRRQLAMLQADENLVVACVRDVTLGHAGSVRRLGQAGQRLLAQPDVDGALVGGASLALDSFTAICRAGARIRS